MIKLRFTQFLLLLSLLIMLVLGISACGGGGSDPDPQPQPQPAPATGESPRVAIGSNAAQSILSTNFSMKVVVGPSFAGEATSNSFRIISSDLNQ